MPLSLSGEDPRGPTGPLGPLGLAALDVAEGGLARDEQEGLLLKRQARDEVVDALERERC